MDFFHHRLLPFFSFWLLWSVVFDGRLLSSKPRAKRDPSRRCADLDSPYLSCINPAAGFMMDSFLHAELLLLFCKGVGAWGGTRATGLRLVHLQLLLLFCFQLHSVCQQNGCRGARRAYSLTKPSLFESLSLPLNDSLLFIQMKSTLRCTVHAAVLTAKEIMYSLILLEMEI